MSLTSAQFSSGSTATESTTRSLASLGIHDNPDGAGPVQRFSSQQESIQFGGNGDLLQFPRFTEAEIKNALKAEAEKHPTWKTAAVKRMKLVNIDTSVLLRYTLETFTETRSTYEVSEPYKGGKVDALGSRSSVSVWDIVSSPKQMFMEETQVQEMPGTSFIQKCETCNGQAQNNCYHCRNTGGVKCTTCNGTGMRTGVPHPLVGPGAIGGSRQNSALAGKRMQSPGLGTPMRFESAVAMSAAGVTMADLCHICGGRGVKECSRCKGQGKSTCPVCSGSGHMRTYTALKIRYELDKTEYMHEQSLPDEILEKVRGEVVILETGTNALAIRNFPIDSINDQSRRLIQTHLNKHAGSAKILQQRHMLEAIPVAKVTYDFNGQNGMCWVVGLERIAYVPQYPKKCCIL